MEQNDTSLILLLNREEMLSALDTEINHFQTAKSWTGRNRWALTLSISALLWLGIQDGANPALSRSNIALLAISLLLLWEILLKAGNALDSALLPAKKVKGTFFTFAPFFRALRSVIFLHALKQAATFAILLYLPFSRLLFLKFYFACGLCGALIGIVFTYVDIPPIPNFESNPIVNAALKLHRWLELAADGIAAFCAMYVLNSARKSFCPADIRMGVIIAAAVYLLTLLVEEKFPLSHLSALYLVRRNLAFRRISPEIAQNQIDLLLFSGSRIDEIAQQNIDSILTSVNQIREGYEEIEKEFRYCTALRLEIYEMSEESLFLKSKREELGQRWKSLMSRFDSFCMQHDKLLHRIEKFKSHLNTISFFSEKAAKEAEPIIRKLNAALLPLNEKRDAMKEEFQKIGEPALTSSQAG